VVTVGDPILGDRLNEVTVADGHGIPRWSVT
jgi:hypothetical protein